MDIVRTYGGIVEKVAIGNPRRAGALIRFGLHAELFRTAYLPDKEMPKAYRFLNHMAIKEIADALDKPDSFLWTNIFAPVELIRSFGLSSISVEAIASYMSGFQIEDSLIDSCEACGIASTLCSYHKCFIGACEQGILSAPVGSVTTSMICDGNVNTFRYLRDHTGIPSVLLDIPQETTPATVRYVVEQLEEFVGALERWTGRSYDEDALKELLARENRCKELFLQFLAKRKAHRYPDTLTLRLFMIFATHLSIGSEWVEEFFQMLADDIERYPADTGKRLLWVHLTPYAQPSLARYLNYNPELSIAVDDFNLDYTEPLDVDHPLEALARKMLDNVYNGPFSRKVDLIEHLVDEYDIDGVVDFCHWGCKQSAGGVQLIKERMRAKGIPMLVLDGDAIDRRSSQDGQTRTRLEAFLELLEGGEGR